jgi:hypothetical protein
MSVASEGTIAPDQLPVEEREKAIAVLAAEYGVLAGLVAAVWSASLVRTSLFLGVISAIGVALGFAAQAGGGIGPTFTTFGLVALPLALFLGIATFVRTVEIQREAVVYITGMNRIRWFMTQQAPAALPYLVLPTHDDEAGVYRSQGTGMRLRPPSRRIVFALVQTQGIVAVMTSAVAGVTAGLAASLVSAVLAWIVGGVAFLVTCILLFSYWTRSLREIRSAIRPMNPTPPDVNRRI